MANSNSISATCGSCGTALVTDDLLETDVVSCANCGLTFSLAEAADIETRVSRQAVLSMLLGFASIICLFLTGIPAIIFGARSLGLIRREPAHYKGRGLAIAGIVTGSGFGVILGTCLSLAMIPAVPTILGLWNLSSCEDHLQDIGFALHGYEDKHGSLPPAASRDKDGNPLLSWRVLVLPYFHDRPELKQLHDRFHLDEPWDSQHNRQLVAAIPDVYQCPTDPGIDGTGSTLTHYAAITGPGTVFDHQSAKAWNTKNPKLLWTVLVGEVTSEQNITWTEPKDVSISEYSEQSGWLDKQRFGSFDSHHVIPGVGTDKIVHLLHVDQANGHQFLNANGETIKQDETAGHFHFRRRLIGGGHSLKHLTLTEVEVFSGGESISPNGTATQSSTLDGAVAGRANDGKTDGGQHAFSRTKLEPYPWWELTFKEPVPVKRIVLNRLTDWDPDVRWSLAVKLLDSDRKVLWHETVDGTIPVNQNFTQEWSLSGSDSAKASKPIVARFLRLEFTEPDTTETAGSQAGPGNKPITGLPILVEKKGERFYITEELDVLTTNLRGAELLAIKEYNSESFQDIDGFLLDDVRMLLQGPAGSTIVLRIQLQENREVKEISLKAITYTPPVTSPGPTSSTTPPCPSS